MKLLKTLTFTVKLAKSSCYATKNLEHNFEGALKCTKNYWKCNDNYRTRLVILKLSFSMVLNDFTVLSVKEMSPSFSCLEVLKKTSLKETRNSYFCVTL